MKPSQAQKEPGAAGKRQRARDVSAPRKLVTVGGRSYALTFSNAAIRTAEDVYTERYSKSAGFAEILRELVAGKYAALQAILYGALTAGGCDMTWEAFDRDFRVDGIEGVHETIMQGIKDSLPGKGEKAPGPR